MASRSPSKLLPFTSVRLIRLEFPPPGSEVKQDFGGGYNSRDSDIEIADNELSGGQNIDLTVDHAIQKRKGHSLYGSYIGNTTGIQGLFWHDPQGGTQEFLAGWDTTIQRYVAGTWTALTGVTMTTATQVDSAYFPLTSKTYFVNGTDQVVKYTSGAAADQTDASFKKGKYIVHYKNRLLVANVSGQADYVWYTDLGVDTFSANNYLRCEATSAGVTGMVVLYDKWLTFTKKKIFVTLNFGFNGTAAGPESFIPLANDFGAVYERTIAKVKNLVYFLGQDSEGIASVYATDGQSVNIISDIIRNDMNALNASQLTVACAVAWGRFYRLSVASGTNTTNNVEYLYDTVMKRWLPPYTNTIGGFSCYVTAESSGQLISYAGNQGVGTVHKLNQVQYDETIDESYQTIASLNAQINANPAQRIGQAFKLQAYKTTDNVTVTQIWVRLKKNAGTTTNLTLSIQTDNNNNPSGTQVANASGTITAFTSTSYSWYQVQFATAPILSGSTKYWVVVQHATEGSGNSQYFWSGDAAGTYTAVGTESVYSSSGSATQSFSPNTAPETTSVDGYVGFSGNDTFANVRGGTGNVADHIQNTTSVQIQCDPATNPNFDSLYRGIVLFDTSGLPADAVITAATVKLYVTSTVDQLSQSIGITAATPASNTTIGYADYATANFGSTRFATDSTIPALTTNAYNTFTLNASGRAAVIPGGGGVSKFAVRLSADIDNAAPTWGASQQSRVTFNTADAGASVAPILTVTYTSVSGSNVWSTTGVTANDMNFLCYTQGAINGYADTKAFFLAPPGQKYHMKDLFVTAKASGSYPIQVGINAGSYPGFVFQDMSVAQNVSTISTFKIGTSVLGQASRSEQRLRYYGVRERTAKFRFLNRMANQPFTVYGYRIRFDIINKLK